MQMLTCQLLKIRFISILKDNLTDFCKWQSCTPGSTLTYLAPQDKFSLVPNYFLGPPKHEKMLKNINSFGLYENAWLPWQMNIIMSSFKSSIEIQKKEVGPDSCFG